MISKPFTAWLKNIFCGLPIYEPWRNQCRLKSVQAWEQNPGPEYPPHMVKEHAVIEHANLYKTRIFIETGTLFGDMLASVRCYFDRLYSIELDHALHEAARRRFAPFKKFNFIEGDSGQQLPLLIQQIHQPALFWLDGHYSGGITARGEIDTPISAELNAILHHSVRNHVILIDDARCFNGTDGYPELKHLEETVKAQRPDLGFSVRNDIIRILPPR